MIINDLDDYYIVFDTKNRNIELDTLSFRPWKTPPLLVSVCALADIVKQRMIAATHHLLKMDVGVVGLQPSVLSIFLFMIS